MASNTAEKIHNLDVTVWVGKAGIDPVADELSDQLDDREFVKVRFHRSALGGTEMDEVAADLADLADAELVETRGHTGVYR
ncbi:MAG: YhbY family RNA-binding protein [Halobacteriaceae archaeon]